MDTGDTPAYAYAPLYRSAPEAADHLAVDEAALQRALADGALAPHAERVVEAVRDWLAAHRHGDLPRWQAALDALAEIVPVPDATNDCAEIDRTRLYRIDEEGAVVAALPMSEPTSGSATASTSGSLVGSALESVSESASETRRALPHGAPHDALRDSLMQLCPWRKGPYRIGDVFIDTEWRSDWKWNRIAPHVGDLSGQQVLDVGCGNGYHLWRMREAGASRVVGIDPGLLFVLQYQAVQHFLRDPTVTLLPLTLDALPRDLHCFDTVFSMGVLYHRRDAVAHLEELSACLRPGGRLVLETLVLPGEDDAVLDIDDRYARMRNVHALPTMLHAARWLEQAGFTAIKCVSVDITSVLEQRTTAWMPWESLSEALDAEDRSKTVEGLPRPRRAVFVATPGR